MEKETLDAILAISTIALAVATAIMAAFTWKLAYETKKLSADWRETSIEQIKSWESTSTNQISAWHESATRQIGVQTWLAFEARFDSKEMKRARAGLATQLEQYNILKHDGISEDIFDLFESIASVYFLGLLNKNLATDSFGYYVCHWWQAAQSYVQHERRIHSDDSLFLGFEKLAAEMGSGLPKIDADALKRFLASEKMLEFAARAREAAELQPVFQWIFTAGGPISASYELLNRGQTIRNIATRAHAQGLVVNFSPTDALGSSQAAVVQFLSQPKLYYPITFSIFYTTIQDARFEKRFSLIAAGLVPEEQRLP